MADVFISYAKTDRPLALKLAAMLEAEGWTTWWDTTLVPGDDFRNEIMTQLGRARTVIVIWTDTSIKSDWVRSEAGRAQADRKLIPVKLPHLVYEDLPPPFDVLHTENIGEEDKIKAAVVAQLAKPEVKQSPWALLTKGAKYELLTWVGIVGGALTLFTNLGAVLKLADWARVLVQHWREWTHAFWVWVFSWWGIHLPPEWTPILSFLLFGSLLTIGQAFKYIINSAPVDRYKDKSFRFISWRTFLCLACTAIVEVVWINYGLYSIVINQLRYRFYFDFLFNSVVRQVTTTFLIILCPIVVLVTLFAKHKTHAAVVSTLIVLFWIIIVLAQFMSIFAATIRPIDSGNFVIQTYTGLAILCMLPLILLSVAPAKAVTRRLIFLALGLLLLIALNELSKLVHYWGVTL